MFILTTVIGYLTGVPVLLIIMILLLVQNLFKNQRMFDPAIKFLGRAVPFLFGIRVKVECPSQPDPAKQYIFMANHINIFDGFILYGYIKHFVRGIELESHFKWPVWGAIIRALGNIPISQKSTKQALETLEHAAEKVRKGTSIVVLPEGHRTRDGKLQRFSRGPFILAASAGADIVPIAMLGLFERKSVKSFFVKPGTVTLRFGEIIPWAEINKTDSKQLRDRVKGVIQGLLKQ
jgi:1-acyl-sn-glycerol-3-phosphate acyltransferase